MVSSDLQLDCMGIEFKHFKHFLSLHTRLQGYKHVLRLFINKFGPPITTQVSNLRVPQQATFFIQELIVMHDSYAWLF